MFTVNHFAPDIALIGREGAVRALVIRGGRRRRLRFPSSLGYDRCVRQQTSPFNSDGGHTSA
jgi:hypothetical protein